jgi:DNA-binding Lrp family transcriptional regulator
VAIINRRKVGLPVTVFVSIRITQHDENWFARFADAVALPEVQEFHRMSGDIDYLFKVVTSDIEGYDRFYKKLIKSVQLSGVSRRFRWSRSRSPPPCRWGWSRTNKVQKCDNESFKYLIQAHARPVCNAGCPAPPPPTAVNNCAPPAAPCSASC